MLTVIKKILFIAILGSLSISASAQSYVFGIKGGPVLATQNWSGFQRGPLVDFHAIASIETWGEDDPNVLFAQLGYHTRGSSLRQVFVNPTIGFNPQTRAFKFRNLAATVGAKKRITMGKMSTFYSVGIRGEYNLSTNLDEFRLQNQTAISTYPLNDFVRKFTYGIYVGGGAEFEFLELIGGVAELSINPDINRQYFQPPLTGVINPNPGNGQSTVNLPEREIRNLTIEITVGLRFLRKVEYYD